MLQFEEQVQQDEQLQIAVACKYMCQAPLEVPRKSRYNMATEVAPQSRSLSLSAMRGRRKQTKSQFRLHTVASQDEGLDSNLESV